MIESAYALSKFIDAKNMVFNAEEQEDTDFLFNLETETAFRDLDNLVAVSAKPNGLDGVVFGPGGLLAVARFIAYSINTPEVTACVVKAAHATKAHGQDLVVGGGVSMDAIAAVREIQAVHLTRYETRKVISRAMRSRFPISKRVFSVPCISSSCG